MRRETLTIVSMFSILCLSACISNEDAAKRKVQRLLKQVNSQEMDINYAVMTPKYAEYLKGKSLYTSNDWKLTTAWIDESTLCVTAIGMNRNGLGQDVKIVQKIYFTPTDDGWKIFDSHDFIADVPEPDFGFADYDWDNCCDRYKSQILEEMKKEVTLEIVQPGNRFYGDMQKGKIRVVNNSRFDIENMTVLIEHFDFNGRPVGTDRTYISGVLRKDGYREAEWLSTNCSPCYRQEFKISFETGA